MMAGASRLEGLIAAAHDRAPDARCTLLREITDIIILQQNQFREAELQHVDVILSLLLREASPALRREIAERLADWPGAPKGVITALARDGINVADPILRRSQTLSDEELIAIVREKGPTHMKAAARRHNLGEPLAEVLAELGDEETLVCLAKNQRAQFSLRTMRKLVCEARRRPALQEPLTSRIDLPPQLLTQLYFFVPLGLKKEVLARSDLLDPSLVEVAITANRRKAAELAEKDAASSDSPAKALVAEKIREGAVDDALLRSLISNRQYTEFVIAFTWLTGVSMAAAQIIIKDRTFEPLAIACRDARISRQTFARIVFSLRRGEEAKQKALRILDLYPKAPAEAAERIMRFWRMRSPEGRSAAFASYTDNETDADKARR